MTKWVWDKKELIEYITRRLNALDDTDYLVDEKEDFSYLIFEIKKGDSDD